jgi:hypothetical protein
LFQNVCLQPSTDRQHLTAWLLGAASSKHITLQNLAMALLQQHLQRVLEGEYSTVNSRAAAADVTQYNGIYYVRTLAKGIDESSGDAPIPAVSMSRKSASRDSSKTAATEQPAPEGAFNSSGFEVEPAVAVLWRTVRENQYSFGHGECCWQQQPSLYSLAHCNNAAAAEHSHFHNKRQLFNSTFGNPIKTFCHLCFCFLLCAAALLNEAFPVFLALHSHFHSQQHLPMRLQLLLAPTLEPVLRDVLSNTITPHTQLLSQRLAQLPAGVQGICFRQLLLGDGGYQAASRASLANSGSKHAAQYAWEPSFFSSANWWAFRQHVMQVRAVHVTCSGQGGCVLPKEPALQRLTHQWFPWCNIHVVFRALVQRCAAPQQQVRQLHLW